MIEARYDSAIRFFRESSRMARQVGVPGPSTAPSVVPQAPAVPEVSKLTEPEPAKLEPVVVESKAATPTPQADPRKALPRAALQKYLSQKKTASKAETPKPAPEVSVVVPTEKPVVQTESHKEVMTEKPVVLNEVVVAPATPTLKPVPKEPEKEKAKEKLEVKEPEAAAIAESLVEESSKDAASAAKAKPMTKRRIPDSVGFIENDPSLLTESMTTLNQTSKYLLENPSTTLVLQAQLGSSEARTLVGARYDTIKAYLVGKGVPEDQIQLDEQQKRGKAPEFLMFVIEH